MIICRLEKLLVTHEGRKARFIVILIFRVREVVEKDFGAIDSTDCHRLLDVVKVGCWTAISLAAFGVDEELERSVLDHGWK